MGVLGGHSCILCRVSAPFSCDTCGRSFSYTLRKKVGSESMKCPVVCDSEYMDVTVSWQQDMASSGGWLGCLPAKVLFVRCPRMKGTSLGKGC